MTNRTATSTQSAAPIGALTPGHLDEALALSRQAGWPHRREDWALVLGLSRGFAAFEGGRLVGTALATPFGAHVATVNMVIVDEAMRGRGLGRRLMDAAMQAVAGREQRLVATRDGLPLYEKLGFRAVGQIVQRQGPAPLVKQLSPAVDWRLAAADMDRIAEIDRAATGADRAALLRTLAAAGAIAVLRDEGGVGGFVGLRAFGRGQVAGPVAARSQAEARALLEAAFARCAGGFVRVDTPDSELDAWLAAKGLAAAGGGVPMVRDPRPRPAAPFHTFALASQALG
ncbi:GNAT family N-acetyltransferase [Alsobacter soli]|uniref:GNAT family N-acetyltransferase n=1 Tax=Alsobacter soli TaxID=2109933 RepID=A0A2T1HUT9_9HYPH|nr:GNAT family N-acetyltransferase [Alsobacter soli]PSC05433.1 GNAT family N-acetyltransferase [Alsobacter soli]